MTDARLDALQAALEDLGFVTVDLDGDRIADASPGFCALVDYACGELLALPDIGPLLAPAERARVLPALADGAEVPDATVLLRRDGSPVEVLLALRRLDGRRSVAVVRDNRDDAARRQQLAAYAEVLQRMPMGMVLWRVDEDDDPPAVRVVAANRAATAGSAARPADLLGRTVEEVFPGSSGLARADEILDAHRTRRLVDLGEVEATEADGVLAPGTYRRAVVPLPGGLVATLVENVTARREAERHRRELLQRILEAGGEERRRVAVGLHDDVIQTMAASIFEMEAIKRQGDPATTEAGLSMVQDNVRSVIGRLRALVFDLIPPELEEGLGAGVDVAAEKTFAGSGTAVECRFELAVEPDAETARIAYQIVAEALGNARRHARASTVRIDLASDAQWLVGTVADDGVGADELVTPPGHLGLRTMRERAELMHGACSVRSTPGKGTVVEFRIPTRSG